MANVIFHEGSIIQFLDDDGTPLASGTVTTYITGTTTAKDTYTTAARTIANSNPLTLDSSGRGTFYLALNGEYRFLLKDSAGGTVATIDDISAQSTTFQGCLVVQASGQLITSSSLTAATPSTETYDTDAFHSGALPGKFTVPAGPTYMSFGALVVWPSNATGYRGIYLYKNGVTTGYYEYKNPISGDVTPQSLIAPSISVTAADVFHIVLYQTSGGNLTTTDMRFWCKVEE